jgi:hypothetical protein
MSKLVRTLMLGAMLVAMNLAAANAIAQERTTDDAAELFRAGERASQEQTTTGHAAELFRAGERASQAHRDDVGTSPAEATQPARSAEPGGRPGLLVTLGVLAAALAAATATRATRRVRARQAV